MDIKAMMNKFSFSQMTSNADGKTSMSGCMGGLICAASAIGFIWGAFTKQSDLITQAVAYAVIGAGLLGYRKSKEGSIIPLDDAKVADPAPDPVADPGADKPLNS